MPHKHKRLRTGRDEAQFNLPPSTTAKGLPVKHAGSSAKGRGQDKRRSGKSRKDTSGYQDDTPRAFVQLMQLRKTGRGYKGLDDGRPAKQQGAGEKRKRGAGESADTSKRDDADGDAEPKPELRIKPGERLGDYAARVDQALPVSGLIAKHKNSDTKTREQRQTKHEKKLQRLVNNWKAQEAMRLEKAQEEWDEADEDAEENEALWAETKEATARNKKGGKRGEEDPWDALKRKRERPKGVFDVVQAPPQFGKAPREFKERPGRSAGLENVPNAGSLRRQEVLSETRNHVIERYRQMMQAKRGEA